MINVNDLKKSYIQGLTHIYCNGGGCPYQTWAHYQNSYENSRFAAKTHAKILALPTKYNYMFGSAPFKRKP